MVKLLTVVKPTTYTKYNTTWGEEAYVRDQFDMMKHAFVDKGIPVILGEYGANWRQFSNGSIQKKHDGHVAHSERQTGPVRKRLESRFDGSGQR